MALTYCIQDRHKQSAVMKLLIYRILVGARRIGGTPKFCINAVGSYLGREVTGLVCCV